MHSKNILAYKKQKTEQVKAVVDLVKDKDTCYQVKLLKFFGEYDTKPCGICSVCKSKAKNPKTISINEVEYLILKTLESKSLSSADLARKIKIDENKIIIALEQMLENNKVKLTVNNLYQKI